MLRLHRPPTWNQASSPFHPQNEEYWTEQGRIAPLSPVGSIAPEPSLDAGAGQNGGHAGNAFSGSVRCAVCSVQHLSGNLSGNDCLFSESVDFIGRSGRI